MPLLANRPCRLGPVGRYAPSPTGKLHLGNARTALLAWLQIRQSQGTFILRMEDLDPARSVSEYALQILEDLRWLGIDWDEGPDVGGPCSPYIQSLRNHLYEQVLSDWVERGLIYPCACSRKDLANLARAPHGPAEEGPPYPGLCRHLSPESWQEKYRKKGQASYRFLAPEGFLTYTDGIYGPFYQDVKAVVGDFVVRRADKVTAYQLAVVVDDALMGVTHVLRGDDLLSSTPRQILLYEALNAPVPRFYHVPLVLGPDGVRLSKRHKGTSLESLRAQGISPEEVTGFLAATAGLLPSPEPISPKDLVSLFSIDKLPRNPFRVTEKDLKLLGL
ncbi:tRNA glutamyl-Q(34) synthetase GluQRS [Heliobacterium chlorum]|uniref:Glutamyl-Q tRNA(Asp) synthetase n=1 Tax=Heliobacterium chlorum TaxID=2698 RepID=A0ABR7SZK0_HELCL|nr:tRNA glutamyl-Q(34) synthetase GluQRS [Heliobacterium chlorum]MBC9783962.1 tRNA glutamyl-Q(34) synthetase GluQRS [Heliobacterium chlorum]